MISDGQTDGAVVDNWAALAGRWELAEGSSRYLGPEPGTNSDAIGLALGSIRFRDGEAETAITLSRTDETSAGILFGFQSLGSSYLAATLGAFDRAYSIVEFQPGFGWHSIAQAGSLRNLKADKSYRVSLQVNGQEARFSVDGVDVIDTVLPRPIEGTGLGFYAYGEGKAEFAGLRVRASAPSIFVMMPFREPFDTLYREVIAPIAEENRFQVVRIDEIAGPGIILNDIQQQIAQSHAVVAEITTPNPNVFYELGYAHALRKPAILLVRREEGHSMPFDVRSFRAIFYDDTIGGKKAVERSLRQHLAAIASLSREVTSKAPMSGDA